MISVFPEKGIKDVAIKNVGKTAHSVFSPLALYVGLCEGS